MDIDNQKNALVTEYNLCNKDSIIDTDYEIIIKILASNQENCINKKYVDGIEIENITDTNIAFITSKMLSSANINNIATNVIGDNSNYLIPINIDELIGLLKEDGILAEYIDIENELYVCVQVNEFRKLISNVKTKIKSNQ